MKRYIKSAFEYTSSRPNASKGSKAPKCETSLGSQGPLCISSIHCFYKISRTLSKMFHNFLLLQMTTLDKFDISSVTVSMKANYDTHLQYNVMQWHSTGFSEVKLFFRRYTATVQRLQCDSLPEVTEIVCIISIASVHREKPESKCEIARNYIGFSSLFKIFDNVTPTTENKSDPIANMFILLLVLFDIIGLSICQEN